MIGKLSTEGPTARASSQASQGTASCFVGSLSSSDIRGNPQCAEYTPSVQGSAELLIEAGASTSSRCIGRSRACCRLTFSFAR